MEVIARTVFMYAFLLILLRLSGGKRSLSQITTFDFILLLIISEVTQQALTGNDFSMTNSITTILTLVSIDIAFTLVKQRFSRLETWLEGVPLIILKDGKPLEDRMEKARLDESDLLEAARKQLGLERLDQIKFAVLEKGGDISVVPYSADEPRTGPRSKQTLSRNR